MNRRSFLQATGLSSLFGIKIGSLPNQPNPPHKSLQQDRLDRMPERIYAEEWKKLNKRKAGVNHGFTYLEFILCPSKQQIGVFYQLPPVSERDAQVASSVIQWLGTNCGLAFIGTCEDKIKKFRSSK